MTTRLADRLNAARHNQFVGRDNERAQFRSALEAPELPFSLLYLGKRSLPPGQHSDILGFTHGHPLALSLVVDVYAQRGDVPTKPEDAPDVVRVLLEQLVQKVPGPAHRSALEACALVRLTT